MKVAVDLTALRGIQWQHYAIRFGLGGTITVIAGLLAKHFGPVFGGLFLAFPAIFPASATLIARRERQKKAKAGLNGAIRGRKAAALDAAGSVLGAVGLACFALVLWYELPRWPEGLALGVAASVWLVLSTGLWWIRKKHLLRY